MAQSGGSFLPNEDVALGGNLSVAGSATIVGDLTVTGTIADTGSSFASPAITGTVTGGATYTAPVLTTPTLGVAAATSINKVVITAPATASTLTIADGKTLTVSNILTLAGTDSTVMTFPTTSASIARTDAANTFTGVQTMTSPALTTPTISGAGYMQVAVVSLAGAAWHTGNGTADFLSWTVPATGVVLRVVVNITTKATGAATADIGYTGTDNHTNSDNLLDGLDIGTAAILADNFGTPGTNGKYLIGMTNAKWVTFHANADPTGTVGNAYIYYMTV